MKRLTARDEKTGDAYFPECFRKCDGHCRECEAETDYCETFASYEDTGLTPEQVEKLSEDLKYWKNEARKQAATAGEIRIVLAERLEEVRTDIAVSGQLLLVEDSELDRTILSWKISQKKSETKWLEQVLYGRHNRGTGKK